MAIEVSSSGSRVRTRRTREDLLTFEVSATVITQLLLLLSREVTLGAAQDRRSLLLVDQHVTFENIFPCGFEGAVGTGGHVSTNVGLNVPVYVVLYFALVIAVRTLETLGLVLSQVAAEILLDERVVITVGTFENFQRDLGSAVVGGTLISCTENWAGGLLELVRISLIVIITSTLNNSK